jgi:hypothetical protein
MTDVNLSVPLHISRPPLVGASGAHLTALMAAAWFVTPRPSSSNGSSGAGRIAASSVQSALAIGCPVCNKLVVAAVDVSGAFGT